jgi:hypothetical protein
MPQESMGGQETMGGSSPTVLTWRERGLRRAKLFLGTSRIKEFHDPLYSFLPAGGRLTTAVAGGGTAAAMVANFGGAVQLASSATGGGRSLMYDTTFPVPNPKTTSPWMARGRLKQSQAVGANTRLFMEVGGGEGLGNRALIGVFGASQTGGSATKFAMIKYDSGIVQRAGALSTISLDTAVHEFELWHPAGSSLIFGSVDEETPLSMADTDMADTAAGMVFEAGNGGEAVNYAMRICEMQMITVDQV